MRKTTVLITILTLALCTAFAAPAKAQAPETEKIGRFSISAGIGTRGISDDIYSDAYSGGGVTFYAEAEAGLFSGLKGFIRFEQLSRTGEFTYTLEEITLKISAVEAGPRFLVPLGKIKLFPYIGAGAGYYMVKETTPVTDAEENKLGFFVEGGLRFYLIKSLFLDARCKMILLELTHENETLGTVTESNLNGVALTVGVGYTF